MERLKNNQVKDFLVTGEKFSLVVDDEVPGMLRTMPRPFPSELGKYYDSKEYISHTDGQNNLLEFLYRRVKKYNLSYKKNLAFEPQKPHKALDYGCGTGDFVHLLLQNQVQAFGYEPNEKASQLARHKIGKHLLSENEVFSQKYDLITLWHVLEHIPNYDLIFSELLKTLNPNGRIIVALPNHKSYDAQFYKNYWAAYDAPRHLWHFSPASVQFLAKKFGTIIERVCPMYFDAFYVSLLSEKYKQNPLGIIRAPLVAAYSNLKAIFTKQYSSLIYVMRKN
uniref:class I SAM-dependent methyltransferase n=1 Tax=Ornithobacterium rhinotracheale TaxID=28251 RepID=UPI0039A4582E